MTIEEQSFRDIESLGLMATESSLRKRVVGDIAGLSAASAVAGVANFANAYLGALYLGPLIWGVWQGAKLVLQYGANLHLGVQNGMHREIPILRGKGDLDEGRRIAKTVFSFTVVVAVVTGIGVFFSTWAIPMSHELKICLQLVSAMVFLEYFHSYFGYLLRAHNCFVSVTRAELISGGGAVVGIPLIVRFGLPGFLVAQVLRLLMVTGYLAVVGRALVGWGWDRRVLLQLMFIGLPIMLMVFASVLFSTVDRVLILGFLDAASLGHYSLGAFFFAPLLMAFTASNSVMYPRFAERYGQQDDPRSLRRYIELPMVILACVLPVLIGVVWIGLPIAVHLFLPEYVAGIPAARILLFGLFFFAIAGMPGNMLLVVNKQILRLAVLLVSSGLGFLFSYLGLRFGYDLAGVAGGASAAYLVFLVLSTALAVRYSGGRRWGSVGLLLRTLSPVCLVAASLYLVEWLVGPVAGDTRTMVARTAAQGGIFLALTGGLVYVGLRTAGMLGGGARTG